MKHWFLIEKQRLYTGHYWFSLRAYLFLYLLSSGHIWFFHCLFIDFLSLAPSGEGGGSSQDKAQALRSSKQLQNDSFSKLFVRVAWGGDRREEGDPASGLRATVVPLSGRLWRRWREQPRNAPDASELQKASKRLLFKAFRKGFRMRILGLLWGSHFCVLLTHVMRRT